MEALEVLIEFNQRLLKNMRIVVKELSGERLDDTDIFLRSIIDAMNWEIQVTNGTMELLNGGQQRIDKEKFNTKAIAVSEAITSKEDMKIAMAIQDIIPYFELLGEAADAVIK